MKNAASNSLDHHAATVALWVYDEA